MQPFPPQNVRSPAGSCLFLAGWGKKWCQWEENTNQAANSQAETLNIPTVKHRWQEMWCSSFVHLQSLGRPGPERDREAWLDPWIMAVISSASQENHFTGIILGWNCSVWAGGQRPCWARLSSRQRHTHMDTTSALPSLNWMMKGWSWEERKRGCEETWLLILHLATKLPPLLPKTHKLPASGEV